MEKLCSRPQADGPRDAVAAPTNKLVERNPRALGGPELETPAQSALMGLLELSLGSAVVARAAVAHALTLSGRSALPPAGPELVAFVRAYLVAILTGELGPRLTLALLDDLAERLDPDSEEPESKIRRARSSAPAASARRPIARLDMRASATPTPGPILGIVVVDPDTIGRPALARALLRAKWSVTVVDSPAELAAAHEAGDDFGVALVATQHPLAYPIVQEVVARYPSAAVIVRCSDAITTHARLSELGPEKVVVRPGDASPEELVDVIRRTIGF